MKINGAGDRGSYDAKYSDDETLNEERVEITNRSRANRRSYDPAYDEPGRRPAAEREKAFNVLFWLVEGATGVIEELRHNDLGLSEDFWVHAYAARREGLLAIRAVLDQLLVSIDAKPTMQREREKRRKRRGGINVDF